MTAFLVAHAVHHGSAASPLGRRGPRGSEHPDVTLAADPSRDRDGFVPDLCRRFATHLGGTAVSYDDVVVDASALSAFQRELLAAARSLAWGEVVTYGGLAALAGRPRAARAAGRLLRGEPLVARRPLPSRRRGGAGRAICARRLRPLGAGPQATPACARGEPAVSTASLASDARSELAALVPERRCDRLAEISALFHTAGCRASPRPGDARVPPRPRGVVRGASGVRRPAEPQGGLGDPHVPPSRVRPGRRATQLLVEGTPHTIEVLTEAGVLGPRRAAARPAARTCRRPRLLPVGATCEAPSWAVAR